MGRAASSSEAVPTDSVASIERLYGLYVDDIFQYSARRLGRELALDITAETFRVAYERIPDFVAGAGNERGWLYGIAMNLMRNHWRSERRRLAALAREGALISDPVDPLLPVNSRIDAERRLALTLAAVAELEPEDRDLLILFAWERCSYAVIATALGIPVGTVRSRLSRIRKVLHSHANSKDSTHE